MHTLTIEGAKHEINDEVANLVLLISKERDELKDSAILKKSVKTLREMKVVQCNDGNWNYNPYMHGMANGIIFSLSLFDDKQPEYLEAPEEWLEDNPDLSKPISEPTAI